MTDELRGFVREAVGAAFEGGPRPGTRRSDEPTYGGGSEGTGDYPGAPGWRPGPDDTYADQAEGEELADAEQDAEDDDEAAAAAAQVMETLSDEDAAAIEAGDLALWETRFREAFPDWDDQAEADDDEDAATLVGRPLQPAIEFVEALLAEPNFQYPDGEPVDVAELMRWMVSAPEGEFDEWAAQVGWDGPQPGIDDLPTPEALALTATKLDERREAIELAKERGERPPYLE